MKAFGIPSPGSSEPLSLVDIPTPKPARGDVLVRVAGSAVNPADLKVAQWAGPARFLHAKTTPLVPGYDFSGVVETVGADVRSISAGDPVFGHLAYASKPQQGAWSEFITIAADRIARKPDALSHSAAASSATVGLTALQALRDQAKLQSGGRVLVIGASGGVGSYAVAVAKRLGAHVTAICSTYAVDFVRSQGADEVVDRKKTVIDRVSGPFDVVFDTTGSYSFGQFKAGYRATVAS